MPFFSPASDVKMEPREFPSKQTVLLVCISAILAIWLSLFFKNSNVIVIGLVTGSYALIYIESLKFLLYKHQRNQITRRIMNLTSFMLGLPFLFPVGYLLIVRPELV